MVEKVIILFSLLLFHISFYVHTLSIISGCIHEFYKVKSLTAAGGSVRGGVSENVSNKLHLCYLYLCV